MMRQTTRIPDTQLYGLLAKHANNCLICGADLPTDVKFQQYHMARVHKLVC